MKVIRLKALFLKSTALIINAKIPLPCFWEGLVQFCSSVES